MSKEIFNRRRFMKISVGGGITAASALSGINISNAAPVEIDPEKWDILSGSKGPVVEAHEAIDVSVKLIPLNFSAPSIGLLDLAVNFAEKTIDEHGKFTIKVPDLGLATPADDVLPNNISWIFAHSYFITKGERRPGTLNPLPGIKRGDVLMIDANNRETGKLESGLNYEVDKLLLTDKDGGEILLHRTFSSAPLLYVQTSIREEGEGKEWLYDRKMIEDQAEVQIEGDIDDPGKYLLLFARGVLRFDEMNRFKR